MCLNINSMRKFMAAILFMATVCMAYGRTFEIKVLNTPTITIDDKECGVGDKFGENAKISWAADNQAMKVLSDDNKIYVMSPKIWQKYKVKDFKDFLVTVKNASVRNDGEEFPVSVSDHRLLFEDDFLLLDPIRVRVGWRVDDTCYFEATTNNLGDDNFTIIMPYDEHQVIITRDMLGSTPADVDTLSLTVRYVENDIDETTLITDAMTIYIMPETVDLTGE